MKEYIESNNDRWKRKEEYGTTLIPRFRLRNKDTLEILYMWTKCGFVKPICESHATLQKQRYRSSKGVGEPKAFVERDWSKIRFALCHGAQYLPVCSGPTFMQAHSSNIYLCCFQQTTSTQEVKRHILRGIQVCFSLWCDKENSNARMRQGSNARYCQLSQRPADISCGIAWAHGRAALARHEELRSWPYLFGENSSLANIGNCHKQCMSWWEC